MVSGEHQRYFYNATATLSVAVGDSLFSYVYLDPANPPSEVMLQWNNGSWEHRAYWGMNLIGWGSDGTADGAAVDSPCTEDQDDALKDAERYPTKLNIVGWDAAH
jgi:hypothetical protein